jgi:hypothetical protein
MAPSLMGSIRVLLYNIDEMTHRLEGESDISFGGRRNIWERIKVEPHEGRSGARGRKNKDRGFF